MKYWKIRIKSTDEYLYSVAESRVQIIEMIKAQDFYTKEDVYYLSSGIDEEEIPPISLQESAPNLVREDGEILYSPAVN